MPERSAYALWGLFITLGLLMMADLLDAPMVVELALEIIGILFVLAVAGQAVHDRLARRRIETETAQLREIIDNIRDLIVRTGLDGRRRYVSPSSLEILGWAPEELIRKRAGELLHPEDRDGFFAAMEGLRRGLERITVLYRQRRKDGRYVWIEARVRLLRDPDSREPVEVISVGRDVSDRIEAQERLVAANRDLEALAETDGLTGIANRRCFDSQFDRLWAEAQAGQRSLALLMLDVDKFKLFNDTFGHQGGDECLRAVARTIDMAVRKPGDLPARFGGEEFAVLLPDTGLDDGLLIAERIRAAIEAMGLAHPRNGAGVVTASIGLAIADFAAVPVAVPAAGSVADSPAELLEQADGALYRAKNQGRNQVTVAEPVTIAATGS